jgi:ribosomal protein S18 acetylase RimI-like enzyme
MLIGRAERVRMERAHVRAWPALRTADIEGWLWRCSGGGSQRANSVSTIDFAGDDPEAAVTRAETLYHAAGRKAQFQIFDETSPPGLAELLRRRGYRQGEPTVTMFKLSEASAADPDVEMRDHPWEEWLAVYLGEITESRRTANAEILNRVPQPRAFFGCRRGGRIVSTALCVAGFDCAVVECVTTRSAARRQGAARAAMAALELWAAMQGIDRIGLQVVRDNDPAVALYKQLGFIKGASNSFWLEQ